MTQEPVDLPLTRTRIFDPPPELAALRETRPVCPVRFPDRTQGWLVTSHEEVRRALGDNRLSARHELRAMPPGVPAPPPASPGFFVRMDAPEHTHYRRLITGHFTRRRLQALVPAIERITDEHLDRLEAHGSPADLIDLFAIGVPSLVVGELLGVDELDREQFARDSRTLVDLTAGQDRVGAASIAINASLRALVERKRRTPGEDILSALLSTGELTVDEVAAMAFLLLVAGHETTANMAGLGVFALLCHPALRQAFVAALEAPDNVNDTDGPVAAAVEELLRYLTINQFGAMRVALTDLELGGQQVRQGEAVMLSLPAANRDPARFPDPDRLLLDRDETGQLAFGYGAHLCSGHQLARLELRIMYARLFRRFPGLRLAVAPQDVPLRLQMSVYGVERLPVSWE